MNDYPESKTSERVTSWTLIHAAADGSKAALDQFAQRYEQVVRNCLAARWNRSRRIGLIDDAVQEVSLSAFDQVCALQSQSAKPKRFSWLSVWSHAQCHAPVRNEPGPNHAELPELMLDEGTVGRLFDREYAQATVKKPRFYNGKSRRPLALTPCDASSYCMPGSMKACPFATSRRVGRSMPPGCTMNTRKLVPNSWKRFCR